MLNQLVHRAMQDNSDMIGMDDMVEKEILHHHLLYLLHREGFLSELTFMGGTALRLCYNSNRLSENLDFAGGEGFRAEQLKGFAAHMEAYLQKAIGLSVKVYEPSLDNSDTSTWKVTIIKYPERPDLPAQKLHIDICAYPALDKKFLPVKNHYPFQSPIAGLPIAVESLPEILCDKIIAFAYRERRIKPRDVWDLAWLSQKEITLTKDMLSTKLLLRGKANDDFLEKILKHAQQVKSNAMTKQDFYKEMGRFVPPSIVANTLAQPPFWQYIGDVVYNYVESAQTLLNDDKPNPKSPPFKM